MLTALTMLAFAVSSLDSASKTLVNDSVRLLEERKTKNDKIDEKQVSNTVTYATMTVIGILNIILLVTGFPRLFTILLCLLFVPFFIRAMKYAFGFAFGMIDYSNSGTVTKEEYESVTHEKAM